jgi:hypothetical protein
MTWTWNNAVKNYVLINKLLPQVQNTLWIYAENILNSRLSIHFKMAHWLRHRRGDVGRPPLWRIVCSSLQIMKNTANQKSTRHRIENCSNTPQMKNNHQYSYGQTEMEYVQNPIKCECSLKNKKTDTHITQTVIFFTKQCYILLTARRKLINVNKLRGN